MPDHLNDLPKRTDEHVGEDESRRKFNNLVSDPYFIVRGETENDYGSDVTVEALDEGGSPTNFRAHVQLKCSTTKPNKDGSFSYQVARTNLNYLLNSPSSFYCFLARTSGRVLYRMAEAEYAAREDEGDGWRSQASITIRFQDDLDAPAIVRIRNEVISVNRYLRNLNLGLRTQAISLQTEVLYDPANEEVRDVGRAKEILRQAGLALVATGELAFVSALLDEVPDAGKDSTIWLVSAYLSYTLGGVFDAVAESERALAAGELSDDLSSLAKYIRASCKFARGLLNTAGLAAELADIESEHPSSISALYARMDRVRRDALGGGDDAVAEVEGLVADIEAGDDKFEPLKIQANIILLEARYFHLHGTYMRSVAEFRVTEAMGVDGLFVAERARAAKEMVEEMTQILRGFEGINARASELEETHPALIGEVINGLELCLVQNRMAMEKTSPRQPGDEAALATITGQSLGRLNRAVAMFQKAGSPDGALRSQMLQVDVLWVAGSKDDARDLAEQVRTAALRLGLGEIAEQAKGVVEGTSPMDAWASVPSLGDGAAD